MRNKSKGLIGMLCLATGTTLLLSILLPNWIWSGLCALLLIGCGALLFFC